MPPPVVVEVEEVDEVEPELVEPDEDPDEDPEEDSEPDSPSVPPSSDAPPVDSPEPASDEPPPVTPLVASPVAPEPPVPAPAPLEAVLSLVEPSSPLVPAPTPPLLPASESVPFSDADLASEEQPETTEKRVNVKNKIRIGYSFFCFDVCSRRSCPRSAGGFRLLHLSEQAAEFCPHTVPHATSGTPFEAHVQAGCEGVCRAAVRSGLSGEPWPAP